MLSYSYLRFSNTKDWVVVQMRPNLTLGAGHKTQPFCGAPDVIDTLTN